MSCKAAIEKSKRSTAGVSQQTDQGHCTRQQISILLFLQTEGDMLPSREMPLHLKFIAMKPFTYLFFIALISLTFSCSDDDPVEVLTKEGPFEISELAGNWEASKAQFSVNTVSVDVVEDGGTARLTVQSNGRFTLTIDPVDRDAYTVSGEMFWEEWQQTFYFAIAWDDDPADWDTYGHTFDGTTLSLNGGADTGEYDFDNDGDMEACSAHFIFESS